MLILNKDQRLVDAVGGVEKLPTCAVFADPQSESAATYQHVERMKTLCKQHAFDLHIATAGSLIDLLNNPAAGFESIPAFTLSKSRSVGMLPRECTRAYKIAPITRKIRDLVGVKPRQRVRVKCVQWIGISLDEIARCKPSRLKWQVNQWPLIDMRWRRLDCMNYLEEIGMSDVGKSACVFCPFHSDPVWLDMKRNDPDSWTVAVDLDRQIRDIASEHPQTKLQSQLFLHRSCVPLSEVELGENQLDMWDMWDNECEGMCGV
jgi:hypothetical protein